MPIRNTLGFSSFAKVLSAKKYQSSPKDQLDIKQDIKTAAASSIHHVGLFVLVVVLYNFEFGNAQSHHGLLSLPLPHSDQE
jgi:hypothetical protein